jgi:hypothetical protein
LASNHASIIHHIKFWTNKKLIYNGFWDVDMTISQN